MPDIYSLLNCKIPNWFFEEQKLQLILKKWKN